MYMVPEGLIPKELLLRMGIYWRFCCGRSAEKTSTKNDTGIIPIISLCRRLMLYNNASFITSNTTSYQVYSLRIPEELLLCMGIWWRFLAGNRLKTTSTKSDTVTIPVMTL